MSDVNERRSEQEQPELGTAGSNTANTRKDRWREQISPRSGADKGQAAAPAKAGRLMNWRSKSSTFVPPSGEKEGVQSDTTSASAVPAATPRRDRWREQTPPRSEADSEVAAGAKAHAQGLPNWRSTPQTSATSSPQSAAGWRKSFRWRDQTPPRTIDDRSSQLIQVPNARSDPDLPAAAANASETPPTVTGVVVGKKSLIGWKNKQSTPTAEKEKPESKKSSQPAELERPVVVGVAGKRSVASWKHKNFETSESQDSQTGAMDSTSLQDRLQSPASASESAPGHLSPSGGEEPSFNGNVSFNLPPPEVPEQGSPAAASRPPDQSVIRHGASLQDLELRAARLREECETLRQAQEMVLFAEQREDAVEICRTALTAGSAGSLAESAADDRILVSGSAEDPPAERDMTEKAEALCRDLRAALQRMVSRHRTVEKEHLEAEEAHESVCLLMGEELQDGALELAWAEERLTLEQELVENMPQSGAAVMSPSRDLLRPDVAHEELLTERLRRDVAQSRLERARQQHGPGGLRLPATGLAPGSPSAPSSRAATLRAEARELRRGLKELEEGEEPRHDDQPNFISLWEERLYQAGEALCERNERVRMGEAELRAESAKAGTMAAEAASQDLAAAQLRSQHSEVSARVLQLEASRHALEETVQPLRWHAEAFAEVYQKQKQQLFAYGAALERMGAESPPDVNVTEMLRNPASGIRALIRTMARTCGSPEVAFLRLDLRRSGRLSVQDFQTGLLLGLGIDYLAVTGLTSQKLFASIDCERTGVVTASNLAACCPQEWLSQGAPGAGLAEKLRAMPWAAVGGAQAAFSALATSVPQPVDDQQDMPQWSMSWPSFEELICQQLRGLPELEARELFEELAADQQEVSEATWAGAVAEPGAF